MLNQTTPVSTPLDTLKALVLRNIEHLEYITDRLGGGEYDIPDEYIEYLSFIRQQQYKALNEHLPVGHEELLGELRYPSQAAYRYDDGTPVKMALTTGNITSTFYPRYDGTHDEAVERHQEFVTQVQEQYRADTPTGRAETVWGLNAATQDLG